MKKLLYVAALLLVFSCSVEDNEFNDSTINQDLTNSTSRNELKVITSVAIDANGNASPGASMYVTTNEYQMLSSGRISDLNIFEAVDKNFYSVAALREKDINPIYDIPDPLPVVRPCLTDAQKEYYQNLANTLCEKVPAYCCVLTPRGYECMLYIFSPNNGCPEKADNIYDIHD